MDQPDPELVDAVLSLTIAVAAGDGEAAEVLLRAHDPEAVAITAGQVVWRMAAALGQLVDPKRSPAQMIHIFAQALKDADGLGGLSG
jgi:hypothetical protein